MSILSDPPDGGAPERTALYRLFGADNELLYVGITNNPERRLDHHRARKPWWREVTMRVVEWYDDRPAAERAERKAIQTEGPRYNIHHNQKSADLMAVAAPARSYRTLSDLYEGRDLTDAQARKIVALLRLGGVR